MNRDFDTPIYASVYKMYDGTATPTDTTPTTPVDDSLSTGSNYTSLLAIMTVIFVVVTVSLLTSVATLVLVVVS